MFYQSTQLCVKLHWKSTRNTECAVGLSTMSVWCDRSSRRVRFNFIYAVIARDSYLSVLQNNIALHISILFLGEVLLWRGRCDTSFSIWVGRNFLSDFSLRSE